MNKQATAKAEKPAKAAPAKSDAQAIAAAKAAQADRDAKLKAEKRAEKEKAAAEKKAAAEAKKAEAAEKKAAAAAEKAAKEAEAKAKAEAAAADRAEALKALEVAQKAHDEAQAAYSKAKETLLAAKRAARVPTAGSGSTALLAERSKQYTRDTEHKTAGGNASIHCGDAAAQKLLGKSLDECYEIAADICEEDEAELRAKYAHLNPGMQRMNLGNKIRGVLNAK